MILRRYVQSSLKTLCDETDAHSIQDGIYPDPLPGGFKGTPYSSVIISFQED